MKIAKTITLFAAAWFLLSVAMTGCTCVVNHYHYSNSRPQYVAGPPPAPKEETQPSAPSNYHVWISGYWDWDSSEETWIWEEGCWDVPPQDGMTWREPAYNDNDGDWVFVPGRWSDDDSEEYDHGILTDPPHRIGPPVDNGDGDSEHGIGPPGDTGDGDSEHGIGRVPSDTGDGDSEHMIGPPVDDDPYGTNIDKKQSRKMKPVIPDPPFPKGGRVVKSGDSDPYGSPAKVEKKTVKRKSRKSRDESSLRKSEEKKTEPKKKIEPKKKAAPKKKAEPKKKTDDPDDKRGKKRDR